MTSYRMGIFSRLPDVEGPVVFSVGTPLVVGTVPVTFVVLLAAKSRKQEGGLKL